MFLAEKKLAVEIAHIDRVKIHLPQKRRQQNEQLEKQKIQFRGLLIWHAEDEVTRRSKPENFTITMSRNPVSTRFFTNSQPIAIDE